MVFYSFITFSLLDASTLFSKLSLQRIIKAHPCTLRKKKICFFPAYFFKNIKTSLLFCKPQTFTWNTIIVFQKSGIDDFLYFWNIKYPCIKYLSDTLFLIFAENNHAEMLLQRVIESIVGSSTKKVKYFSKRPNIFVYFSLHLTKNLFTT